MTVKVKDSKYENKFEFVSNLQLLNYH